MNIIQQIEQTLKDQDLTWRDLANKTAKDFNKTSKWYKTNFVRQLRQRIERINKILKHLNKELTLKSKT